MRGAQVPGYRALAGGAALAVPMPFVWLTAAAVGASALPGEAQPYRP